jgi:hypothetical protein
LEFLAPVVRRFGHKLSLRKRRIVADLFSLPQVPAIVRRGQQKLSA